MKKVLILPLILIIIFSLAVGGCTAKKKPAPKPAPPAKITPTPKMTPTPSKSLLLQPILKLLSYPRPLKKLTVSNRLQLLYQVLLQW